MCKFHSSIDNVASNERESIFGEGEQHGAQIGPTLRHVWEEDKRTQHEETQSSFQGDQKRSSTCFYFMFVTRQIIAFCCTPILN